MMIPVTDQRETGEYENQAEAISRTLEVLGDQITELSAQVRELIVGQRI